MDLQAVLTKTLSKIGFSKPTPVQAATIPGNLNLALLNLFVSLLFSGCNYESSFVYNSICDSESFVGGVPSFNLTVS